VFVDMDRNTAVPATSWSSADALFVVKEEIA
jgi:hypothetical protein